MIEKIIDYLDAMLVFILKVILCYISKKHEFHWLDRESVVHEHTHLCGRHKNFIIIKSKCYLCGRDYAYIEWANRYYGRHGRTKLKRIG